MISRGKAHCMIKSKVIRGQTHGMRTLCWRLINNGCHVQTTEKSANNLFMEFLCGAVRSEQDRDLWLLSFCFLGFSWEGEECTWNNKTTKDGFFFVLMEKYNHHTRTWHKTEWNGTKRWWQHDFFNLTGWRRGGQKCGSTTGELLNPQSPHCGIDKGRLLLLFLTCPDDWRRFGTTLKQKWDSLTSKIPVESHCRGREGSCRIVVNSLVRLAAFCLTRDNTASIITLQVKSL